MMKSEQMTLAELRKLGDGITEGPLLYAGTDEDSTSIYATTKETDANTETFIEEEIQIAEFTNAADARLFAYAGDILAEAIALHEQLQQVTTERDDARLDLSEATDTASDLRSALSAALDVLEASTEITDLRGLAAALGYNARNATPSTVFRALRKLAGA